MPALISGLPKSQIFPIYKSHRLPTSHVEFANKFMREHPEA